MYYLYTVTDSVRVPPKYIGEDVEKATTDMLRAKYERTLDKDMGIMLVGVQREGRQRRNILPGDPYINHDVTFDVLAFSLAVDEVVAGEVSELADFGCS